MSDRGTWISFKNKADLVIAVEGDKLRSTSMVSSWLTLPSIRM
jgi:ABC-type tungstate transport system permease subunit